MPLPLIILFCQKRGEITLSNFVYANDGSMQLSEKGMLACYYQTLQKLLSYYLKNQLNYSQEQIVKSLERYEIFAGDNFTSLNDYTEKLPQLSAYIEIDATAFSTFVGKSFLNSLEKTKEEAIQNHFLLESAPVFSHELPSKKIMAVLRLAFELASPLVLPLEESDNSLPESEDSFTKEPQATKQKKQDAATQEILEQEKKAMEFLSPLQKTSSMPSKQWQQVLEEFASAQLLDLQDVQKSLQSQEQSPKLETTLETKSNQENEEDIFDPSELASIVEEDTKQEQERLENSPFARIDFLPSKSFLNELKLQFDEANDLHAHFSFGEPSTKTEVDQATVAQREQAEAASAPIIEAQLKLKEYAILLNKVAQFQKNKDQAGYKQWHSKLNLRYKIALHLNKLIVAEKQNPVSWKTELKTLHEKTYIEINILQKYVQEIRAYRKTITSIRLAMKNAIAKLANAQAVQKGYSNLIDIFENQDSVDSKKVLLKMHLMGIQPQEAQDAMATVLMPLLEKIKTWYPLA